LSDGIGGVEVVQGRPAWILPGMPPAVPVPSGDGAARPDFWFPLALFGVIVALPVPLNAADWPDLRSAPSALIASGGDPLRTLVETGPQTQPWELALLPALVLLVAAWAWRSSRGPGAAARWAPCCPAWARCWRRACGSCAGEFAARARS
jgi:hypothetical protein